MKLTVKFLKYTGLILSACLALSGPASASADEKVIAVSPFKIESREPLEFLEKGIVHMLESRLEVPGHASVVFLPRESDLGGLEPDYILKGTILVFGNSVSTDAKLIPSGSDEPALVFSRFGKEKGEVLNHIDLFAERIRTEVLHLDPVRGVKQALPAAATGYGPGPYMDVKKPVIWRSGPLQAEIRSIAVADINRDSKNETIILSEDRIQVFRRTKGRFEKLSELSVAAGGHRHLFADVIDLDGDGTKEIFITSVNDTAMRMVSSLYRWNESGLVRVAGDLNWILRAVDTKQNGRILLGQTTKGDDSRRLETGVYRMKMDGPGRISPAERSFSFADSPLGLAFGDFLNNGRETVAMLDLKGKLSIYDADGTKLFTNREDYGGSEAFIEYKGHRYNQRDDYQKDRIFLQQRIFSADLYGDGKISLVTVKNNDATKGFLSKVRQYDRGHIESLVLNEMGMAVEGRTQDVPGYICDFTVADMDNDGKKEIVFATVTSEGLLKKKTSRIISQSFIVKGIRQAF